MSEPAIFDGDRHATVTDGRAARDTVLTVTGVSKRFGTVPAVRELTFEVRSGEVFGLLGPNGAGKTTAIRMICGELAPDEGRILLHGRPIRASADDRARVGLCPQELVVWDRLTCREQLEFIGQMYRLPRRRLRERAARLLAELGLDGKAGALGATLSGGLKRRLNIALAVVHEPELAVLDEPAAGLDPQSRVLVRDFIRSLARHRTVLLTTHDMDEAERICDRVAIIDRGCLLVCDTPEELKRGAGEGPDGQFRSGVIELRFSRPVEHRATSVLAAIPDIDVQQSPGLLTVRAAHADALLPDLVERLRKAGVPADEVRLRATSLEDVFLALTGRTLRS
nr:ABC transporter ATP-binding protein [Streptomyces sp. NBC_00886]